MTASSNPEECVAWVSRLTGHPFDLEDLVYWTSGNPIHVVTTAAEGEPERYSLYLPFTEVGQDYGPARERAEKVMVALNGLGAAQGHNFEPVSFDASMNTVDRTGQRRGVVVAVQGTSARTEVGRVAVRINGVTAPDPTKGMAAQFLAEADGSDAVNDALQLIGRHRPTWSELYVAYELVKTIDAEPMAQQGWVDKTALALFKRTANSRTALGVQARHGAETTEPPKHPMSDDEARKLIRQLVLRWVTFRAGQAKK